MGTRVVRLDPWCLKRLLSHDRMTRTTKGLPKDAEFVDWRFDDSDFTKVLLVLFKSSEWPDTPKGDKHDEFRIEFSEGEPS